MTRAKRVQRALARIEAFRRYRYHGALHKSRRELAPYFYAMAYGHFDGPSDTHTWREFQRP